MKILKTIAAVLLLNLTLLAAKAQTEVPAGFKKGTIVVADGNMISGYVKENIRKNASLSFISDIDQKRKNYDGSDLKGAEIDGVKYICIKGDFFKVLCEGELSFLQKSSDASGKPSYNGIEPIYVSGTEGKPNDYFIYNNKDRQLKLVSKKNKGEVVAASFAGCNAAIDKAKSIDNDLSQLKEAVVVYNNRNN